MSAYLDSALDPKQSAKRIKEIIETVKYHGLQFDFIAVSGMSGALLSGALSIHFGVPVVVIRKDNDNSHGRPVEVVWDFPLKGKPYIIIDDGIASGKTICRIISELEPQTKKCSGILLYSQEEIKTDIDMDDVLNTFKSGKVKVNTWIYDICVDDKIKLHA
jgi:adenine/guanine phosphoribosyltransferase-like PRPP-binding protein